MKIVNPSVKKNSFNCPHCHALAQQFWYDLLVEEKRDNDRLPYFFAEDGRSIFPPSQDLKATLSDLLSDEVRYGSPFIRNLSESRYVVQDICNLHVSRCYNCKKISIWIFDRLVHPKSIQVDLANPDMPDEIKRDYNEAGSILNQSPRGAAALLRLAIQKLCKELGQPGKNINDDIAGLVKSGIDARVQQALDAVRVIGNNAVHPGQIDLRDDQETAKTLFKLLNLIVEKTISEPKHIKDFYESLPEGVLREIEKRDKDKK